MVTNLTGGFTIVADMRELENFPAYASALRIAQEITLHESPAPDRVVVIAPPVGALFGKCRQFVSMLTSLGMDADLFTDEPAEARMHGLHAALPDSVR